MYRTCIRIGARNALETPEVMCELERCRTAAREFRANERSTERGTVSSRHVPPLVPDDARRFGAGDRRSSSVRTRGRRPTRLRVRRSRGATSVSLREDGRRLRRRSRCRSARPRSRRESEGVGFSHFSDESLFWVAGTQKSAPEPPPSTAPMAQSTSTWSRSTPSLSLQQRTATGPGPGHRTGSFVC